MAKSSRLNKRKQAQSAKVAESGTTYDRRAMLKLARNGIIGLGVVGVAGFLVTRSFNAMSQEHDLTRIGNGKPAVVQVHDPQCSICTALQRETRKAMKQFGEDDMLFLVADITQPEGGEFSRKHGVPHITLLLFDAQGELQQVLRGMKQQSEISPILAKHFEQYK